MGFGAEKRLEDGAWSALAASGREPGRAQEIWARNPCGEGIALALMRSAEGGEIVHGGSKSEWIEARAGIEPTLAALGHAVRLRDLPTRFGPGSPGWMAEMILALGSAAAWGKARGESAGEAEMIAMQWGEAWRFRALSAEERGGYVLADRWGAKLARRIGDSLWPESAKREFALAARLPERWSEAERRGSVLDSWEGAVSAADGMLEGLLRCGAEPEMRDLARERIWSTRARDEGIRRIDEAKARMEAERMEAAAEKGKRAPARRGI